MNPVCKYAMKNLDSTNSYSSKAQTVLLAAFSFLLETTSYTAQM